MQGRIEGVSGRENCEDKQTKTNTTAGKIRYTYTFNHTTIRSGVQEGTCFVVSIQLLHTTHFCV